MGSRLHHILPQEIISAIIDGVAHEDALEEPQEGKNKLRATKACSLACRAFLPACRKQIFHSIQVHDSANDAVAHRFVQLIMNNPAIGSYVRKLDYGIRFHEEAHFCGITSALDQLTGLEYLTIYTMGWESDWTKIPAVTKASLLGLICLETIVSLEFRGFSNFLISDLVPCPNLQELSFHRISIYEADERDEEDVEAVVAIPSGTVRPQTLKLANITNSLLIQKGQDNKPILDLSALKKMVILTLEGDEDQYDIKTSKELVAEAHKLECIEISAGTPLTLEDALPLVTDSQSLLATVKNVGFVCYLHNRVSDPLCGIPRALEKIAGKNQIEHIQIWLFFWAVSVLDTDKWGDLERVLLAPGWPSLRRVDLHIVPYNLRRAMTKDLHDLPETQFALLTSSENFKFDFCVSTTHSS